MRSARLRLPSTINLLVKRATLRLLNFASGTSGRRTTFLRLGTFRLLLFTTCINIGTDGTNPRSYGILALSDTRKGVDSIAVYVACNLLRTPARRCLSKLCSLPVVIISNPPLVSGGKLARQEDTRLPSWHGPINRSSRPRTHDA